MRRVLAPRAGRASAFDDEDDAAGSSSAASGSDARARIARSQAAQAASALTAEDAAAMDYDAWKGSDEAATSSRHAGVGASAPAPKQSQYIGSLLSKAAERGLDRERVLERKIAREAEAEAAEFGESTESFVTGAYAARLEERAAREEALDRSEARGDVARSGGMAGFYRGVLSASVMGGGRDGQGAGTSVRPVAAAASAVSERPKASATSEQRQPAAPAGSAVSSAAAPAPAPAPAARKEAFRSSAEEVEAARLAAETRWAAKAARAALRS